MANGDGAKATGTSGDRFPIVALGGSAGALEALQAFLDTLPGTCGMAFVVVTHQHPGRTSLLPELLAKHCALPVLAAAAGQRIEQDHVYVSVPDGQLTIRHGVLQRIKAARQGRKAGQAGAAATAHHPIDAFFRALATDQGGRAVAIVLSGTGTDGAVGIKAVKAQSGMVMAQQPEGARFDGMPTSAIATGLVDHVLPPGEMPATLAAYADMRERRVVEPGAAAHTLDEETLAEIFALLRTRTNHDFSGYKRTTLRRRIERRMNIHRLVGGADYVRFLRTRPHEIDLLFREIVISVTSFFRDREAWDSLASGPLVEAVREHPKDREFRAWVAGCATGEEAYTLAIVLCECMLQCGRGINVQIFATDVDSEGIEVARVGRYPSGIESDVPAQLLEKYFVKEQDHYRVSKDIREKVVFALQNVVQDPPFTRLDLVSCRNLLIYMQSGLQRKLLPIFHYALRPGALLFLGTSESLGEFAGEFDTVDGRAKVFRRKKGPAINGLPDITGYRTAVMRYETTSDGNLPGPEATRELARSVERLLAARYVPPSVIVNDPGRVIYVHGRTGQYLEPAAGVVQNDLLDMAREGLRAPLGDVLRRLSGGEAEEIRSQARVRTNGGFDSVLIEARRIERPESLRGLRLVSFRPPPDVHDTGTRHEAGGERAGKAAPIESGSAGPRIAQLELELEAMRADQQAVVEQLETSNEELQSTNEELQSTNEELQSTNEELETSKEEMESLNEELTTVNAELEAKVHEFVQANDDMQNLLNSTDIATLFLDEQLHIKRFTKEARKLVALRESDVGRPLSELSSTLRYDSLLDDARAVLDTLQPSEAHVQTTAGDWYLMRLVPYRTTENMIDGLVITFIDIAGVKKAEYWQDFFRRVLDTLPEPIIVVDDALHVVSSNTHFSRLVHVDANQVNGRSLVELGDGEQGGATLEERLRAILERGHIADEPAIEVTFRHSGRRMSLEPRMLDAEPGGPAMLLLVVRENS